MHDDWDQLYLERIKELEARLREPTGYNVLSCCLLIRTLIADEICLVDRCRAKRDVQILFEATKMDSAPTRWPGSEHLQSYAVSPNAPRTGKAYYKTAAFLQMPTILFSGNTFSVKQVLDYCAYVKGGIHVGKPKTAEQRLLVALDELMQQRIVGASPAMMVLQGIADVVLKGLTPLTEAIRR